MFERFRRSRQDARDRYPADEGVRDTRPVDHDGARATQPAAVGTAGAGERPAGHEGTHTRVLPDRDADDTATRATRERRPVRDEAAVAAPSAAAVRERQRDEFGGTNWGSAFFGWLVAVGLAALLVALLSAAGASLGLTDTVEVTDDAASANAETIGIVGGVFLLVVFMIAYFAGGYVAGRMSRFDGARNGLGVWLIGITVTVTLALAGVVLGSEYNLFAGLNLPRIPIDEGDLTTGGLIALAAVLVGTLLAAVAGGKAGERYHVKVDRFGLDRH